MTREEIIAGAEKFGGWYHSIELTPGYFTQSVMLQHNRSYWDMIRDVRGLIDYKGKSVLDLGTFNGMWAFEAEKCGAGTVVAADIWQACNQSPIPFEQFMFARQVLGSRCFVVTNADVHHLYDRMADPMKIVALSGFDIVQCLGLLYHVENPMLALSEIRRVMRLGSIMLLETAVWTGGGNEPVMRYNSDNGIYFDKTTFWAPNIRCLTDMLKASGFESSNVQYREQPGNKSGRRYCLIAKAV